jgi:hypothetical protein
MARLGIEQANASQHLAVPRAKNILVNRKTGNQRFLLRPRSVDRRSSGRDADKTHR